MTFAKIPVHPLVLLVCHNFSLSLIAPLLRPDPPPSRRAPPSSTTLATPFRDHNSSRSTPSTLILSTSLRISRRIWRTRTAASSSSSSVRMPRPNESQDCCANEGLEEYECEPVEGRGIRWKWMCGTTWAARGPEMDGRWVSVWVGWLVGWLVGKEGILEKGED
jgi:hypothetical protein